MKNRTLFKGFSKLFGNDGENKRNISASKAISLQQEYIAEACESGEIYQQTYIDIIPQLDDKKEEIADAALFYLKKIALSCPLYTDDIVKLLEDRQKKFRLNKVKKERFAQAISEIKDNTFSEI